MTSLMPGPSFMTKTGRKYKERLERKLEHRALKQSVAEEKKKRAPIKKFMQWFMLTGGLVCAGYVVFTHVTAPSGKSKFEKNGNGIFSSSAGGGEANWDGFTRAVLRRSDSLGRLAGAIGKAWERANTVRDGLWADQLRSVTAGLSQTPDKRNAGGS